MKRDDYQVGDLLIRLSNQETAIITAIRDIPRSVYGVASQKRKEYQLYGRFHSRRRDRRERRWITDIEIRIQYNKP